MSLIKSPKYKLPPLPSIRDLLRLYRLRALKQLSQNFLLDMRITDKIVKVCGDIKGGEVCEIGPGPGSITRSLIKGVPEKIILIEKDQRFEPTLDMLKESCAPKMDFYFDDVKYFDMSEMFNKSLASEWKGPSPNIHLIGNLPFNVSTNLIIRWLRDISLQRSAWKYGRVRMTLTFQKEVAERMVAPLMSEQRCRLSVMCQNWCNVHHKFTIPGRAFLPKPKVDVGVVHFVPRVNPIIPLDFELIEKVLRSFFNYRRKQAFRGAQVLFPKQQREELGTKMFELADLDPHMRVFQISNEEWGRLCHAYKEICDQEPRLYKYDFRAAKTDKEKRWDEFEDVYDGQNSENSLMGLENCEMCTDEIRTDQVYETEEKPVENQTM